MIFKAQHAMTELIPGSVDIALKKTTKVSLMSNLFDYYACNEIFLLACVLFLGSLYSNASTTAYYNVCI